jgi:hypothetical protein
LPGANLIALRPTKRGLDASNSCPAYDSMPIRPPFHMNLSFPDNRKKSSNLLLTENKRT